MPAPEGGSNYKMIIKVATPLLTISVTDAGLATKRPIEVLDLV